MLARPSRTVETIAAGVTRREMGDSSPLDHYRTHALLTERQCEALEALERRYRTWRPPERVTGSYGQRRGSGDVSDDEAELQARAKREYHHLLIQAPAGTRHAIALVASSEWPTMCGALLLLRRGLDKIADHLKLAE
jgi:hypothetical protein